MYKMTNILLSCMFFALVPYTSLIYSMQNDLFAAVNAKDIEHVQALISQGVNVNQTDSDHESPLHRAIRNKCPKIAQLLIAAGADVNLPDRAFWTPLHFSAFYGNQRIIPSLIEAGADICQQDLAGRSPIDIADEYYHQGIMIVLKDYNQRIQEAVIKKREHIIPRNLAMAMHCRLGIESPMALLPQHILRFISELTMEAEMQSARCPHNTETPQ